jgi:multicomponent Na+:H+ antiporter subunit E
VKLLLWNILLAVLWALARGQFSLANLAVGLVVGWVVLNVARRALWPSPYFGKLPEVARFACFYLRELVLSNVRVAYDVVTPTHYMRPGVIAIPLEARTDAEITLLAHLISLTPGSLSVDVSEDRRILYVHVMYIDDGDVERARHRITHDFERRVLQVMR